MRYNSFCFSCLINDQRGRRSVRCPLSWVFPFERKRTWAGLLWNATRHSKMHAFSGTFILTTLTTNTPLLLRIIVYRRFRRLAYARFTGFILKAQQKGTTFFFRNGWLDHAAHTHIRTILFNIKTAKLQHGTAQHGTAQHSTCIEKARTAIGVYTTTLLGVFNFTNPLFVSSHSCSAGKKDGGNSSSSSSISSVICSGEKTRKCSFGSSFRLHGLYYLFGFLHTPFYGGELIGGSCTLFEMAFSPARG